MIYILLDHCLFLKVELIVQLFVNTVKSIAIRDMRTSLNTVIMGIRLPVSKSSHCNSCMPLFVYSLAELNRKNYLTTVNVYIYNIVIDFVNET